MSAAVIAIMLGGGIAAVVWLGRKGSANQRAGATDSGGWAGDSGSYGSSLDSDCGSDSGSDSGGDCGGGDGCGGGD